MRSTLSICALLLVLPASLMAEDKDKKKPTKKPQKPFVTEPHPHAVYPGHFSRPPSMGADYDTWADALGPDVGETKVDPKRLPKKVDNSKRPEYPPIYNQGKHGACGQYASVTAMFSYEQNVLNGTKADSDATRFSPYFSWNMMNRAENKGSEAYHGWEVAKRMGIPTAKTYGGIKFKDVGLWPDGYAIWREAMEYRVRGYRYTPAATVAQLNEAKGWLFDRNQPGKPGGLLAMDGRMGKPPERTFKIPEGEYEAGKLVWTRWNPTGFGHGMACVGYDDEVGYDVNGDGKITNDIDTNGDGKVTLADWERGAYIVANSWGAKWSANGRIYLLYSAMIDPDWKRGNFLGRVEVCRYQPRYTLKIKLACSERSNLKTHIGIAGDVKAEKAEHEIAPEVLNGWPIFGKHHHPGSVPIAGPGKKEAIELGVDVSELLAKVAGDADGKARLFIRMSRKEKSELTGELKGLALRHYDEKGKLIREIPVEVKEGAFGEEELVLSAVVATAKSNKATVSSSK